VQETNFYLGVDLGQRQDPTALAAVERVIQRGPEVDRVTFQPVTSVSYRVRGLRRLKLGTPYPEIVSEVASVARTVAAEGQTTLVVDATGVGAPVVDLLRDELDSSIPLIPVIFTAGDTARYDNGVYRVPKKDLVHGLIVLFENKRLRLLEDHPESRVLVNELSNMRVRITGESHATYEAWRQNQHDDMVFALALACWRGRWSEPKSLAGTKPLVLW
jgi:Terminase RNaseH-like domain